MSNGLGASFPADCSSATSLCVNIHRDSNHLPGFASGVQFLACLDSGIGPAGNDFSPLRTNLRAGEIMRVL